MPMLLRRSADCLAVRPREIRLGADVRGPVKDALIDISYDQNRSLKEVVSDALTDYARLHWQREELLEL